MNNRDHRRATKVLLGIEPHKQLHRWMDAYSKGMGRWHRGERHGLYAVEAMAERFGPEGGLEAALHHACDMGMVTKEDIEIWQELLACL